MLRPLIRHRVEQLEDMFTDAKDDANVLKELEHELQFRDRPRAVALLSRVRATIAGDTPAAQSPAARAPQWVNATSPAAEEPSVKIWPTENLPTDDPPADLPITAHPPQATPTVNPQVTKRLQPPQISPISLDAACKVLKTTAGATWESIEQTRRQLVQQSHPLLLMNLDQERRTQALEYAALVNVAYVRLQLARRGGI